MAVLTYDSAVVYNTSQYTYDGSLIEAPQVSFKEALHIELQSILDGLVHPEHICLDMRLHARPTGSWVVFSRITESRSDASLVRERWEMEVIVPIGQEDTLHAIAEALVDSLAGAYSTMSGYRTKARHINTIENFDRTQHEKSSLLIFTFHYVS